jgi:hypothetical protein
MKFSKEIEAEIARLKGSGFWSSATEARLRRFIMSLADFGLTDVAVVYVVSAAWTMVSAEYGE